MQDIAPLFFPNLITYLGITLGLALAFSTFHISKIRAVGGHHGNAPVLDGLYAAIHYICNSRDTPCLNQQTIEP